MAFPNWLSPRALPYLYVQRPIWVFDRQASKKVLITNTHPSYRPLQVYTLNPHRMSTSIFLRSSIRSFRALRPITRAVRPIPPTPAFTPAIQTFRPPTLPIFAQRYYASGSLPKDEVETRIIEILKGFDKVTDPSKVAHSQWDSF